MPNQEIEKAKDLLSKIYINLKQNDTKNIDNSKDNIEKEKQYLKQLPIIDLINVISNYFNILLGIKKAKNESNQIVQEEEKPLYMQYEDLLIKAENDIRKHIKVNKYFL